MQDLGDLWIARWLVRAAMTEQLVGRLRAAQKARECRAASLRMLTLMRWHLYSWRCDRSAAATVKTLHRKC